ncbi:MAG: HAMP domain-containing protein [Bacteroidetes bacterium]|nr:HAMP domain-containing protein [Bacteroidota bacterium]
MQLRVKTKLSLGLGFLFVVIILIGSLGAFYIHSIAKESKEILKDNYESIVYSKSMLEIIDLYDGDSSTFFKRFEPILIRQEHNITEIGEKENTQMLRDLFAETQRKGINSTTLLNLKKNLYSITDLNMQAILRKNNQAQLSADRVLTYIGIIGGICFVIVFTFIINFPGYIANPIKELTESIKQIAGKNYHQRLHFRSGDEFGELADAFNSMAEKLEHYENSNLAKIMFEKKRIETIINNMKDAIIGVSENRIILFANIQAAQLLGLNETDLIGKNATEVALKNDLMRLLLNNDPNEKPIKIFADGKESYFNKDSISIKSEGKSIGEVILLKNITQFQELDLAKTNFIATISHELKTPIASIKLSSKLLEDSRIGELNEEQKQLITNIKGDSDRLLKITSEVLNMAQVETGRIQLNFQKVEAKEIVKYAVDSLKFQADQKGIQIIQELDESLPPVNADIEKSAWVMVNLLSNAIRYSPENDKIQIKVISKDKYIEFLVHDNGKGIAPQYQDKIFDRFFRIPGNPKHGSGLGLSIAKEFILAQKGEIGLKNDGHPGTTFYFLLPIV